MAVLKNKNGTEQNRKDAIEYIIGQLDNGYIDLGAHDEYELEIVKEAMDLLKAVDKWNSVPETYLVERPYDHTWDMYLDEFEDV